MLLRNPLGRGRRVGGRDWGERRLFDQVRARDPDFVLLRQAAREVRADLCDAAAALRYVEELARSSDPLSAAVGAVAVRRGLDAGGGRGGRPGGDGGRGAATLARGADGRSALKRLTGPMRERTDR